MYSWANTVSPIDAAAVTRTIVSVAPVIVSVAPITVTVDVALHLPPPLSLGTQVAVTCQSNQLHTTQSANAPSKKNNNLQLYPANELRSEGG
jgi:hypothetical protein